MTIHQKIAAGFVTLAFILTAFFPERISSALSIIFSIALYGLFVFLDQKVDQKAEALLKRISSLEEKMNSLMMGRAMGR